MNNTHTILNTLSEKYNLYINKMHIIVAFDILHVYTMEILILIMNNFLICLHLLLLHQSNASVCLAVSLMKSVLIITLHKTI